MLKKIILSSALIFLLLGTAFAQTDYQALGEEWMEQMMGPEGHEAADKAMEEQMGEQFVEQMHEAMGKSLASGQGYTMMPMMNSMMGYGGWQGFRGGMMNYGSWPMGSGFAGGWGWLTGLSIVLFWIGVLALIWLAVIRLWQVIKKNK